MPAIPMADWVQVSRLTEGIATDLRRSIMRVTRLMAAGVPHGELSQAKLSALATLLRHGPTSAGALSRLMTIRPQSLTRVLAHLEDAGLICRERALQDGREHRLSITPRGVELVRQEGLRRDASIREAMRFSLTLTEVEVLAIAAKILEKVADEWVVERVADPPAVALPSV